MKAARHASRSTPNLDDAENAKMVTKKSSMYSYLHSSGGKGAPPSLRSRDRYWDSAMGIEDSSDREDYAHHLRSSSYHLLHSRQLSTHSSGSAGSYHSRQHSNASNYSEPDDLSPRLDQTLPHHSVHHTMDRSRYFSYDNLSPADTSMPKYHNQWNMSEPDLTFGPVPYCPPNHNYHPSEAIHQNPPAVPPPPPVRHSPSTSISRHPSSPPPPPVRDASSLKYIKYGPGHEKFPSWPVPAGATSQVLPQGSMHDANITGLPDPNSLAPLPQGSHRSKSWTEQSEYPKEKAGGYVRPYSKKPFNPSFHQQLKTVMEKCEKIPPETFHSRITDDLFSSPDYHLIDSYYNGTGLTYFPPYDREGRGIDDKDYNIPSPPERDPGMGEANLSQVTAAQLEEYARHYEYNCDMMGMTPLLDQLRQESVMWDGTGSERDSGRGESESVTDSRYSNGRESVTTVVTNSSSASSSETLKWHGSMSDISVMSGQSRDMRNDHNVVHSSRVQAPQRHNSESVLYYGGEHRSKGMSRQSQDPRMYRDANRSHREGEMGYPRSSREMKWNREVERNNEMNNLKKFPSYSYTQPLSQINEAPGAESNESAVHNLSTPFKSNRSMPSPTIDFSKPPSVTERINELERKSRKVAVDQSSRWAREARELSETREKRDSSEQRNDGEPQRRDSSEKRDGSETNRVRERRDSSEHRRDSSEHKRDSSKHRRDLSELSDSQDYKNDRDLRPDSNSTSESANLSRHSRRGSDSITLERDMQLDMSRHEVSYSVHSTPESFRSSIMRGSRRSPSRRNSEESLLSHYSDADRVSTGFTQYAYLDPEKKCKVSKAQMTSIQKQALWSYYERRTGKCFSGQNYSDISSTSSQSSGGSCPPSTDSGKWSSGGSMREKNPKISGKGMARLGRVAESSDNEDQSTRPIRRPSISAGDNIVRENSEGNLGSEISSNLPEIAETSVRSSLSSDSNLSTKETNSNPKSSQLSQRSSSNSLTSANLNDESKSETTNANLTSIETESRPNPSSRPAPIDAVAHQTLTLESQTQSQNPLSQDATAASVLPATSLYGDKRPTSLPPSSQPKLHEIRPISVPSASADESLVRLPLLDMVTEEIAPRPPERPPKKPMLKSLFHGSSQEQIGAGAQEISSPETADIRRIEDTANELRNLSPGRPYYYRKPPAPDPPKSPRSASPLHSKAENIRKSPLPSRSQTTSPNVSHVVSSGSHTSRSSTPDLPPPPPPPPLEDEEVICDEPLPPPPCEANPDIAPRGSTESVKPPPHSNSLVTYHKDSYMAHRRDWKTGFEGRYRRTHSPTAPPNRNNLYTQKSANNDANIINNNINNKNVLKSNSGSTALKHSVSSSSAGSTGSNSSCMSTSPGNSLTRTNGSTSSLVQANNNKNLALDNDNLINNNNNGWGSHGRQQSTTVSFTTEELRAFKAKKSGYSESLSSSEKDVNPLRGLYPAQSTPVLRGGIADGSTTSLASIGAASVQSGNSGSPTKLSPSHSLRTSLDSLHRVGNNSSTHTSSPRPITRATSLGDPLTTSNEGIDLPRTSSINEALSSRISTTNSSLNRSTSITESTVSNAGDTLTSNSTVESALIKPSSPVSSQLTNYSPGSPTSPIPHDGPIIAHPATVTEEPQSPTPVNCTQITTSKSSSVLSKSPSLSPKQSMSIPSPKLSLSPRNTLAPLSLPLSPIPSSQMDQNTSVMSRVSTITTSPAQSASTTLPANISLSSTLSSSSLNENITFTTSPSLAGASEDSENRENIVVLRYGRKRYPEEIECEQLSFEYVDGLSLGSKLQALLAPGPKHKTAADYMHSVFTLEMRKDLLSRTHASHPDLIQHTSGQLRAGPESASNSTCASSNGAEQNTQDRLSPISSSSKSPLPANSAYFTTSESKAKMLTRLRDSSNTPEPINSVIDSNQLLRKKEELVASIGRKLEILRAEREAIKEETKLNEQLGSEVTEIVKSRARVAESDKFQLHVEEIDKITSLLLGLSGRLARAQNALLMLPSDVSPSEKAVLEGKRDKLSEQLEEAKKLKENIDRRAIQVSKVLNKYLSEVEYADYDHFIKMKAKLIMDAREIDDKVKLGDEQMQALNETISATSNTTPSSS